MLWAAYFWCSVNSNNCFFLGGPGLVLWYLAWFGPTPIQKLHPALLTLFHILLQWHKARMSSRGKASFAAILHGLGLPPCKISPCTIPILCLWRIPRIPSGGRSVFFAILHGFDLPPSKNFILHCSSFDVYVWGQAKLYGIFNCLDLSSKNAPSHARNLQRDPPNGLYYFHGPSKPLFNTGSGLAIFMGVCW